MIEVTPDITLDERELQLSFVRSSGPGGQHVNKTATAVQLRFDVAASTSLPDDVKQRLMKLAANRISDDGILIIDARSERSQLRNREAAIERLTALLRRAARPPKKRRPTKPSASAKRKRLARKKQRSEIKKMRRRPDSNADY